MPMGWALRVVVVLLGTLYATSSRADDAAGPASSNPSIRLSSDGSPSRKGVAVYRYPYKPRNFLEEAPSAQGTPRLDAAASAAFPIPVVNGFQRAQASLNASLHSSAQASASLSLGGRENLGSQRTPGSSSGSASTRRDNTGSTWSQAARQDAGSSASTPRPSTSERGRSSGTLAAALASLATTDFPSASRRSAARAAPLTAGSQQEINQGLTSLNNDARTAVQDISRDVLTATVQPMLQNPLGSITQIVSNFLPGGASPGQLPQSGRDSPAGGAPGPAPAFLGVANTAQSLMSGAVGAATAVSQNVNQRILGILPRLPVGGGISVAFAPPAPEQARSPLQQPSQGALHASANMPASQSFLPGPALSSERPDQNLVRPSAPACTSTHATPQGFGAHPRV